MSKITLLLMFTMSVSAYARPNFDSHTVGPVSEGVPHYNYFAHLESMFREGQEVDPNQEIGSYSGRCFRQSSPGKANNQLLSIMSKNLGNEAGPMFEDMSVVIIMLLHTPNGDVNYFDNLSSQNQEALKKIIVPILEETPPFKYSEDTATVEIPDKNLKYQIRRHGEYLLTAVYELDSSEIFSYCYFFKEIDL